MTILPSGRTVILILAALSAVLVAGFVVLYPAGQPSSPPERGAEEPQEHSEESLPPSLDCAFHDFMRTRAVVSFYFDVALPEGETPHFRQRAIVLGDGTRKAFEGEQRPAWIYAPEGDGKPAITSPDGATRIVLYGLKLGAAGVLPVEAGIRSNEYRNLGGECRQTNLGGKTH